jgi:predicted aldo/keto reductase-like oxidoreductase
MKYRSLKAENVKNVRTKRHQKLRRKKMERMDEKCEQCSMQAQCSLEPEKPPCAESINITAFIRLRDYLENNIAGSGIEIPKEIWLPFLESLLECVK